jgi:hypothetical protein
MSNHDVPIGQEWTAASPTPLEVNKLIDQELGHDTVGLQFALAYVCGADPELAREAILQAAHKRGRHAGGRCPEQCPRF